MGRPRIFSSPEEMQAKIEDYFAVCDAMTTKAAVKGELVDIPDPECYTMPGMAYHLGFSARTELADYANLYPEYSDTIARARLKVESQRARDLVHPSTRNANGMKFDFINNFNWKDRTEIEISGNVERLMEKVTKIIKEFVPESKQGECAALLMGSLDE